MDKRREFMLDTETLSLASNAAVWEIAVVEIIGNGAGEPVYWNTDPFMVSASLDHMDVNDGTIKWSLKQEGTGFKDWYAVYTGNSPRDSYLSTKTGLIIDQMLDVAGGFDEAQKAIWWAKNSAFDFPILENFFKHYTTEMPWFYRNKGCLYTMRIEAERRWGVDRVKQFAPAYQGISHGAVDDCLDQINQLAYYRAIIDHAVQVPE